MQPLFAGVAGFDGSAQQHGAEEGMGMRQDEYALKLWMASEDTLDVGVRADRDECRFSCRKSVGVAGVKIGVLNELIAFCT